MLDTKQYQARIEKIENSNSNLKNQLNSEKTKVRMLESRFDSGFHLNINLYLCSISFFHTKFIFLPCFWNSIFDDLADNHTEMIKFKDYHKSSATTLRAENEELRKENESLFSAEIRLRDDEIESWKERNKTLYEKIAILTSENEMLTSELTWPTINNLW